MTTQEPDEQDPGEVTDDLIGSMYLMWAKPDFTDTHMFTINKLDGEESIGLGKGAFDANMHLIRTYIAARIMAHWEKTGEPVQTAQILITVRTGSPVSNEEDTDVNA